MRKFDVFLFNLETSEHEIAMQNLIVRMSGNQKLSFGYILLTFHAMAVKNFVYMRVMIINVLRVVLLGVNDVKEKFWQGN